MVEYLETNILKTQGDQQYSIVGGYCDEREVSLQTKIDNLYKTLDRVSKNSDLRQQQSLNLIEDLKKANRYFYCLEHKALSKI